MAKVRWNGAEVLNRARTAVMRGVVAGTEDIRNEAIRLILETSKSGRIYTRRGRRHQASAPGEPPASDTGTLVREIDTSYDHNNLSGRVVFRAGHAPHLEFGTTKMEARPFARPALVNKAEQVEQRVAAELRREFVND